ncbi:MAG: PorT family protein [Chitinophagaceae bacterium]|nr:PorT family protein [Chitinophagaceae bacterium]
MKRTHLTKQNPARRWITLCLSSAMGIFLLQGCCIPPEALTGSGKPCNCNDKPVYAGNSRKIEHGKDAAQTTTAMPAVFVQPSSDARPLTKVVHKEPVMIQRKNSYPKSAGKKLPLGIKGISTNVIAGPNLSFKSSNEDYGSLDHKHKPGPGVQFGVASSLMFSPKLSVMAGLLFKTNNAKEVISYSSPGEPGGGGGYSEEYESKYSFSYLSVPLLAEIKLSDKLTAIAGPEVNILTGASVKDSDGEKTDIKNQAVKTGVGIQAGVRFHVPKSPVGVQLIYDHRLSRLNEKSDEYYPGGGSTDSPAWRMSSLQLGLFVCLCELFKKD